MIRPKPGCLVVVFLVLLSVTHAQLYDLSGARVDSVFPGAAGIYFTRFGEPKVFLGGEGPILPNLEAWPVSPRSHALAGALSVATADPVAATLNPGVLGYLDYWVVRGAGSLPLRGLCGAVTGRSSAWIPIEDFPGRGMRTVIAVGTWYFSSGMWPVINSRGWLLGLSRAWDMSGTLGCGIKLSDPVGLGLAVKVVHSHLADDWVFSEMPELGLRRGSGTALAVDVGALYTPARFLSTGLSLTNLSPGLEYSPGAGRNPLPTTLRAGVNFVMPVGTTMRFSVPLQLTKPVFQRGIGGSRCYGLAIQFPDVPVSTGWRIAGPGNIQFATGCEVSVWDILWLRAGYFEDAANSRGGLVVNRAHGTTCRVGLLTVLFDKHIRAIQSVGFCSGVGIGYRDVIRLDFSMDHNIYDFGGRCWAIELTAQPGQLVKLLRGRRSEAKQEMDRGAYQ